MKKCDHCGDAATHTGAAFPAGGSFPVTGCLPCLRRLAEQGIDVRVRAIGDNGWRCEFCTLEAQRECSDTACRAAMRQPVVAPEVTP